MDYIQWFIDNKITKRDELRELWHKQPLEGISREKIEKLFSGYKKQQKELADKDLLEYSVKYKQQAQKFQDTNRIERKTFREHARISNALEEYNKEIINILKKYNLKVVSKKYKTPTVQNVVGVIHITDTHFNELIDIPNNKYDFKVASRRLKKLCDIARVYFKAKNITTVLVALTGDLCNSNRRLDELLNQASNRAKATCLAVYLFEQFLLDLNQDFDICVTGVTGNESRAEKELGFADIMASDNYDFTIFNMLKIAFRKCNSIRFLECEKMEQVVNINNNNILLLHGLPIKSDIEKSIQQIIGKYSSKGVRVDYVLLGHIHSARIGDFYARGSSLCGANAYSDYGLNLASRASQNIGVFYSDRSHDVMKIDLQNTDDIDGYDIVKELEAYNAKSVDKLKPQTAIFQVVV